jgi:hypothetical protein
MVEVVAVATIFKEVEVEVFRRCCDDFQGVEGSPRLSKNLI